MQSKYCRCTCALDEASSPARRPPARPPSLAPFLPTPAPRLPLLPVVMSAAGVVKLVDFGLAIYLPEERPMSRLGTLEFMAPETIAVEEVDRKKARSAAAAAAQPRPLPPSYPPKTDHNPAPNPKPAAAGG